ncbi:MAG TPA: hypothetical protein VMB05_04355 [Solirubrobacteraceae bacterium]|nr:hypothetical protein [Solirubrobacteraceae bacterium]
MPVLIRGFYYEGWDPAAEVRGLEDVDGFLHRLALAADLGGETEASLALAAVLRPARGADLAERERRCALAPARQARRAHECLSGVGGRVLAAPDRKTHAHDGALPCL